VVATKFTFPNSSVATAWLTWGRLRYNHTQGILFGWLGNAFLAFFYYACTASPIGRCRAGSWDGFSLGFGMVRSCSPAGYWVAAGFSQPLEWAEFPLVVDAFVVLAFIFDGLRVCPALPQKPAL